MLMLFVISLFCSMGFGKRVGDDCLSTQVGKGRSVCGEWCECSEVPIPSDPSKKVTWKCVAFDKVLTPAGLRDLGLYSDEVPDCIKGATYKGFTYSGDTLKKLKRASIINGKIQKTGPAARRHYYTSRSAGPKSQREWSQMKSKLKGCRNAAKVAAKRAVTAAQKELNQKLTKQKEEPRKLTKVEVTQIEEKAKEEYFENRKTEPQSSKKFVEMEENLKSIEHEASEAARSAVKSMEEIPEAIKIVQDLYMHLSQQERKEKPGFLVMRNLYVFLRKIPSIKEQLDPTAHEVDYGDESLIQNQGANYYEKSQRANYFNENGFVLWELALAIDVLMIVLLITICLICGAFGFGVGYMVLSKEEYSI